MFGFGKKTLKDRVVVVSGLPRSGTSMMMKMLEAGGVPPLTDHEREPDKDNPKGYYEYERVKALKDGDTEWVGKAHGKSVKVIAALLQHLPPDHAYEVIFMRRSMPEILASQKKMLERRGEEPNAIEDSEMANLFARHLDEIIEWAQTQSNIHFIEIDYNQMLIDPWAQLNLLGTFFGGAVDLDAMAEVIDPELYRQRK
jgi:hypothetical protein